MKRSGLALPEPRGWTAGSEISVVPCFGVLNWGLFTATASAPEANIPSALFDVMLFKDLSYRKSLSLRMAGACPHRSLPAASAPSAHTFLSRVHKGTDGRAPAAGMRGSRGRAWLGVHVNAHLSEEEPKRVRGAQRCTCHCLCGTSGRNARLRPGFGVDVDSSFSARYNCSLTVRK